jgi:pheromone shutdown protein TraB
MGQMAEGPEPWSESDVLECRDLAQSYSVPDPSLFSLDAPRHRHGIISHALGGERDEYLAHNIWRASQQPGSTTVAVVGAAHVPGIRRLFGNTTEARFKELDRLPAPCNPFEACVEGISGGTVVALDVATTAVPIFAVARGYAAASQRFSQKVARCGLLGVGAAIAAAAAHATLDMQAKCHRIKSEVYRYDKSQRS